MRVFRSTALIACLLAFAQPVQGQAVEDAPTVILEGVPFSITVEGSHASALTWDIRDAHDEMLASGTVDEDASSTAQGLLVSEGTQLPLQIRIGDQTHTVDATLVPGWSSLIPPIVAIALALLFREVVTALFAGVWLGALAVAGFNPLTGTWRLIDTFIVPALANAADGHTQIVVFSLLLGGMVGIIARNGGTMGIVEAVTPFARTARRGKIATWIAGLAIFFDDYANTLIVGNTMRPITDRLKVSREKLAYIVDSTAAPVSALIPISTWVGYEISLISDGLRIASEQSPDHAATLAVGSPFTIFIHTIPFLFYPILALFLVFLTSIMDRDFGPMAKAERRALEGRGLFREGAQLATDTSSHIMDPKEGTRHRWWNAALPVLTVVGVVLVGLIITGRSVAGPNASIMDVFGAADPFSTLLWGSLAGCIVAIVISKAQGILTITEGIDAWGGGMRAMLIAMVILVLAWSLGAVTEEIGTAQYLAQLLTGHIALQLFPVIVFVTAAAMSFATGTSWGTMAILLPVVIPLTVSLGGDAGFAGGTHYSILLGSISSVLAGAIFGDHCSPISDTTVLSSTASGCDHVDHVRTQLPYALLVAGIGMVLGDIGTAYGLPNWAALIGGGTVLFLFLKFFGTNVHVEAETEEAPTG